MPLKTNNTLRTVISLAVLAALTACSAQKEASVPDTTASLTPLSLSQPDAPAKDTEKPEEQPATTLPNTKADTEVNTAAGDNLQWLSKIQGYEHLKSLNETQADSLAGSLREGLPDLSPTEVVAPNDSSVDNSGRTCCWLTVRGRNLYFVWNGDVWGVNEIKSTEENLSHATEKLNELSRDVTYLQKVDLDKEWEESKSIPLSEAGLLEKHMGRDPARALFDDFCTWTGQARCEYAYVDTDSIKTDGNDVSLIVCDPQIHLEPITTDHYVATWDANKLSWSFVSQE